MPTKRRSQGVVISFVYFSGKDSAAPPVAVLHLMNHFGAKNDQVIVSGDANAHHTVCGSTNTIEQCEFLLEFLIVKFGCNK